MSSRPYTSELPMYPEVVDWLQSRLLSRAKNGTFVHVADTHNVKLNEYIAKHNLGSGFKDGSWQAFEIFVDVTGFLIDSTGVELSFVECKIHTLSLAHLSQLLGYCRVALPHEAWLVSPRGIGSAIQTLVGTHGRQDVLEYDWPRGHKPRHVTVAGWDAVRRCPDLGAVLPRGDW